MRRNIAIILALGLWAAPAAAQPADSLWQAELSTITIQENRLALPFDAASRSVQVVTRQELAQMPVQSLAEALSHVAGLDVRQRGVDGIQADIGIRGSGFDQVLVLINGVKMSDPQTGHHLLNLPIDLEAIERIEVLKGPGARVFGQNAFAGAINIITRIPDAAQASLGLSAGDFGSYGLRFGFADALGAYRHSFSFAKQQSAGYRYNTDYELYSLFYQSEWQARKGSFHLQGGFTERKFGANGFYASPTFANQYEEVQTSLLSLEYRLPLGKGILKPRVYWRRNQDEYIFVRQNPAIYRNLHLGHALGAELNSSWPTRWGLTGLGIEWRRESLQSNNLGQRQRDISSLFAEHRFSLGPLDVTPGLLLSHFSDFGAVLFPGIDAGYRLSANAKLFASAGYTYRVPTYTDLYYSDPANLGNPNLQPERAFTAELGSSYRQGPWDLSAALFRRDAFDLIDWTRSQDGEPWQPSNVGNVVFDGAELSLHYRQARPGAWLRLASASLTYIDAQVGSVDAAFSRYALDNLRWQVTAGLEHRIAGPLVHQVRFRWLDRVSLDDYHIVDSRLTWQGRRWDIFADASNIFNAQYTETNLVPMPGRWFRMGANWRILLD